MCALFFQPIDLYACLPFVNKDRYIDIIKMTGEPNQNIEYLEAIGWLKYKGSEEFFVLNEEKIIIASVIDGSLCVTQKDGKNTCRPAKDRYLDVMALNSYFRENKKFKTYFKIGSGKPIKYIFKKTRSKNNNEYQSQIVRASLQDCEDWGGG